MISKNNTLKTLLLIFVLIIPLAWLYLQVELGNSRKAHEVESLLLEITQVETELTEHVLKSRSQLTLHYDDIATSQRLLNSLIIKLNSLLVENMDITSKKLEVIDSLSSELQYSVERFKSINGQVSQRLRYLKFLSNQIKSTIDNDFLQVKNQVDSTTLSLFKSRVFGETLFSKEFVENLKGLNSHAEICNIKSHLPIKSFILHVNELSALENKENLILDTIFKHELKNEILIIRKELINNKYQMVMHNNMAQIYLITYASVLLLLLIFFIFNQKRIQKNVHKHKKESEVDHLTSLYNRRCFLNDLNKIIANSNGALLFIDLDNFKLVNDDLGHNAGDMALKIVAERLTELVEAKNVNFSIEAYRLGGDEFVILVDNLPRDYSIEMLSDFSQRVVNNCNFTLAEPYTQYQLSVSVGIALFPEQGINVSTVLNCADKAMYHSKSNGRNQFTFYNNISEFNI